MTRVNVSLPVFSPRLDCWLALDIQSGEQTTKQIRCNSININATRGKELILAFLCCKCAPRCVHCYVMQTLGILFFFLMCVEVFIEKCWFALFVVKKQYGLLNRCSKHVKCISKFMHRKAKWRFFQHVSKDVKPVAYYTMSAEKIEFCKEFLQHCFFFAISKTLIKYGI